MVDMLETLQNAGQVSIDDATIISTNGVGLNILNQIVQIDLYEDIFSPFMTGTITIMESLDLLNLFPLVGEETLKLKFHTPTIDKRHYRNQQFYIYQMTDMKSTSDKSNFYVLHFISIESVVNLNTRISRTFGGKVSDIAKKLLIESNTLNSKKQINIEETSNVTKFTANFWSPMKCISYITQTSLNNNNSPSYLFFENNQGLNFVSLDSLYGGDVSHEFMQSNYVRDVNTNTGVTIKELRKDYAKVLDFSIPEGYDYIDRCMGGMYGSQLITIDPITKKYSSRNYSALKDYTRHKHLNGNSLISENSIARSQQAMLYLPKHYGNFNGFPDVTNASVIQQRTSLIKQAEAFKVNMSVYGRSDYSVGQKIYVSIPSKQSLGREDTNTEDKVSSGNYLIAAIHHIINRTSHMIDMELIKDSLMVNINKGGK